MVLRPKIGCPVPYCLEDSLDWFYLVKDTDAWWRKMEFMGWQRHHAREPQLIVLQCLVTFAFVPFEKNDFHISEPHGWDYVLNRCLRVPKPVMFSYLADHLRMSRLRIWKHLARITKVDFGVTTLCAFLQIVYYGVISQLARDDIAQVCVEGGVLIWVAQGTTRKWFETCIFSLLSQMLSNLSSAILAITQLAEIDRGTTVTWFPFD